MALWNERIANRLERAAGRHLNSTLQSVTIGGDVVTMVWQYTNPRAGTATRDLAVPGTDLRPLFDVILSRLPGPVADDGAATTQFQANNLL